MTGIGIVSTIHELGNSAFARTRLTDNRDSLTGLDGKGDIMERITSISITEGDILEGNRAFDRSRVTTLVLVEIGLGVNDLQNTFSAGIAEGDLRKRAQGRKDREL